MSRDINAEKRCPRCKQSFPKHTFRGYPYCPACYNAYHRERRRHLHGPSRRRCPGPRTPAAPGMKYCAQCQQTYPLDTFQGLPYCPPCYRAYHRARMARKRGTQPRRQVPPGQKWCPHCQQVLAVDAFPVDRTRTDGHRAYCAVCYRAKQRTYMADYLARKKEQRGGGRHE